MIKGGLTGEMSGLPFFHYTKAVIYNFIKGAMKAKAKSQYLWGLFLLGLCLLNYPLLSVYNIQEKWSGIPVLYFWVFFFWLLIIILTYWII